MNSRHYTNDRQNREAIITQIGVGTVIKEVVVDRGHREAESLLQNSSQDPHRSLDTIGTMSRNRHRL